MAKKTDNHNPKAKLDLRRYFLKKYHADGSSEVLDCCQGGGLLWHRLRDELPIKSYWGVDVKPKKGRLKIDSVRILAQPGWTQNVIDIDTYGSPWKHWLAMAPNIPGPATIFLTIGQVQIAGSPLQNAIRHVLRLGSLDVPNAIGAALNGFAVTALLSSTCDYVTIMEAVEAVSDGNARYIGIRVEPVTKKPAEPVITERRARRTKAAKEPSDV